MNLILTLLCRDEEDILNEMIRFHFDQGVDLIVATDNGSEDTSRLILERYSRSGRLILLDEHQHNHDQAIWVSRMAQLATDKGADWIIHSDADEFWWPENDDLKTVLRRSPPSVEAWKVDRSNFLPPRERLNHSRKPFHQRQKIRERQSMNSMGHPLPPKICHRAGQDLFIADGNHAVMRNGTPITAHHHQELQILHFPIRSYVQLKRKVSQGTKALQNNTRITENIGNTWRNLYREKLLTGKLQQYYSNLRPNRNDIRKQLKTGELIRDKRLHEHFRRTPRIAVVTPYHKESIDMLTRCHQSVRNQTIHCLHILVADGYPNKTVKNWDIDHIQLPCSHNDIGSTPRLIGAYHAIGLGVEAITFLDADNWLREDHIEQMKKTMDEEKADFVSSTRTLCRLDGSEMGPCPLTDPDHFIDTNCMMLGKTAFPVLHQWSLMPSYGHLIGDRIMLHYIKQAGIKRIHINTPSVFYRCGKAGLYHQMKEAVPEGVSPKPDYERCFRQWIADGNPPL